MRLAFKTGGILLLLLSISGYYISLYGQNSTDSASVSEQPIEGGQKLFTGKKLLSNGGPACISCHSINDPALPLSGGTFAINITGFSALPADALRQRIMEIPFPYMAFMKAAYENHPVTEREADQIIAYLHNVSTLKSAASTDNMAGTSLLWYGLVTFIAITGCIWAYWHGRKKGSVNEAIYKRQIQSV